MKKYSNMPVNIFLCCMHSRRNLMAVEFLSVFYSCSILSKVLGDILFQYSSLRRLHDTFWGKTKSWLEFSELVGFCMTLILSWRLTCQKSMIFRITEPTGMRMILKTISYACIYWRIGYWVIPFQTNSSLHIVVKNFQRNTCYR